jgi:DNA-directed RNA polymerase specialized sigma24 family protein
VTAEHPGRRKLTVREAAEKLGVSPRTVTRIMAEPRSDYLARAAERRQAVLALRLGGLSYVKIGAELGLSTGAVGRLLRDAKRYAEQDDLASKRCMERPGAECTCHPVDAGAVWVQVTSESAAGTAQAS